MSLRREVVTGAAVGVGVADTPEGLSVIHRPGVAAALWRRRPLPAFQAWMDALDPSCLPHARVILPAEAVRQVLEEVCDAAGTPAGGERTRLIDDIAALAALFSSLMRAPYLRLRLDRTSGVPCPRFHVDAVAARLLCTYRGPGTQYGVSTDGAEPRRVFSVPTGAPVILRGSDWPDREPVALLHRSPPTDRHSSVRLLLVLDPIARAEPPRPH